MSSYSDHWQDDRDENKNETQDETEDLSQRCFPSLHTCLLANVIVPLSLFREGKQSRFFVKGSFHPCYLSCTLNFDRDDVSGEIFSVEIAIPEHQEISLDELMECEAASFSLDPVTRHDWLAYFRREFKLECKYEMWNGSKYLGLVDSIPKKRSRRISANCVYTLSQTNLIDFQTVVLDTQSWGGVVLVFRFVSLIRNTLQYTFNFSTCVFFYLSEKDYQIWNHLVYGFAG
jgi:hypothetical protein